MFREIRVFPAPSCYFSCNLRKTWGSSRCPLQQHVSASDPCASLSPLERPFARSGIEPRNDRCPDGRPPHRVPAALKTRASMGRGTAPPHQKQSRDLARKPPASTCRTATGPVSARSAGRPSPVGLLGLSAPLRFFSPRPTSMTPSAMQMDKSTGASSCRYVSNPLVGPGGMSHS